MRKIIYIGIGGFLGAILRYYIKNLHMSNHSMLFPTNTLIINLTGTFILSLILTVAFEIWEFNVDIRIGIATGFLGAYTTFSSMCKETVKLIDSNHYIIAAEYIGLSVIAGIGTAFLGVIIAREVVSKIVKDDNSAAILDGDSGE